MQGFKILLFLVLALGAIAQTPTIVYLTVPLPVTTVFNVPPPATGGDTLTKGFIVTIESGRANGDVLSINIDTTAYTVAFTESKKLTVTRKTGQITLAQAILLVNTVTFTTSSSSQVSRTISYSIQGMTTGILYHAGTDHFYESVSSNSAISWFDARTACQARSFHGRQGYLVTVSNNGEQSFIKTVVLKAMSWMGASDYNVEGVWRWVTGPEGLLEGGNSQAGFGTASFLGQQFSYTKWGSQQPNNLPWSCSVHADRQGQHYAHFFADGWWNDYSCKHDVQRYICEYGGMPSDNPIPVAGAVEVQFRPLPPNQLVCSDLHYWVEEGQFLEGDILLPPAVNNDFHDTMYTGFPNDQQGPSGCAAGLPTITAFTVPTHHTPSPDYYHPKIEAFKVNADGSFLYINVPFKSKPIVWNGYDSFTWTATCPEANGTPAPGVGTCTKKAYVNVLYTSTSSQNSPPISFTGDYDGETVECTGSCKDGTNSMWFTRHTLPRIWDVQSNEKGESVKPTVSWEGETKDTDALEFFWASNYALIYTYGAIGSMAVRFPTFEVLRFTPGEDFSSASSSTNEVAGLSTGFNQACLTKQGSKMDSDQGTDVWVYNTDQQDGTLGPKYASGDSWYQKFGGKHDNCDIFHGTTQFPAGTTIQMPCKYAPLLAPRENQIEDNGGVWRLKITDCAYRWEGKFTWNGMLAQTLSGGNKAMLVQQSGTEYTITGEIYNQAVQPNSWTQPRRGYDSIDHKYLLKIVLAGDTEFQFELGIDAFTVDLQQFRYYETDGSHAFGFNMIVYSNQNVNTALPVGTPQSAPDRRILGYKWAEHKWISPSQTQCLGCNRYGLVTDLASTAGQICTNGESTDTTAYTGPDFPLTGSAGSKVCGRSNPQDQNNDAVVFLYKGPSTTSSDCTNTHAMVVMDTRGLSPADPSGQSCKTTFQNITLRGTAPGSANNAGSQDNAAGFGFEGKITLTFLLANGEHPHFVITPKMYVKSICIDGAFQGTSSTCRGSPYWPVTDTYPIATAAPDKDWTLTGCPSGTCDSLPTYICEEPDARTFGPTDWASIFFDIKDVDADLVEMTKLSVKFGDVTTPNTQLHIRFYPAATGVEKDYSPQYLYLNYRNLKGRSNPLVSGKTMLQEPTAPSGVTPPKNTDFGFSFTPGAHNENTKITIYCTLRIKTAAKGHRRFGAKAAGTEAENTIQERIDINRRTNSGLSTLSANDRVVESSRNSSNNESSASTSVTVQVLASVCAVLLAAVIGMVLYVVNTKNTADLPKRVNSSA